MEELWVEVKPQSNESPKATFYNKGDVIKHAWEKYRQHRRLHWTACHDFYCRTHGSSHQMKNRYPPYSICSICGEDAHGVLDCELTEEVLAEEREYRKQQRDKWKQDAETTTSENETPLQLQES